MFEYLTLWNIFLFWYSVGLLSSGIIYSKIIRGTWPDSAVVARYREVEKEVGKIWVPIADILGVLISGFLGLLVTINLYLTCKRRGKSIK